jgi:uncharacterized protein YjbJ (UPF0337 family)
MFVFFCQSGASAEVYFSGGEKLMIKESTKDQVAGKAREIKGKVQKEIGRAIDRPDIAERGADEEVAGKVRRKVGEVEKVFGQ